MIVVVHPFGNANVRAVLAAVRDAGLLAKFVTSLGYPVSTAALIPSPYRRLAERRSYDLDPALIRAAPLREIVRLIGGKVGLRSITRHETGWASVDEVWGAVDRDAAACIEAARTIPTAVYAYEDCAEASFTAAKNRNVRRIYDLPIAFWETSRALLTQEAERYPEWESTLVSTQDSEAKLARKTREIDLAELVICPSNFVLESIPENMRAAKKCVVVPFGSPAVSALTASSTDPHRPLRVLFAGAMTQRKGLADLFAAMTLLHSKNIQLVVMGSLIRKLDWYRSQFSDFIYEPPRPHVEVLQSMRTCDVLVLPSIVEGRALVQQEAMACGLPVIATRNAGADDIIIDGETGFLVPIRSPEAIAEKISWCADNRAALTGMGTAAQNAASELTWQHYGEAVVNLVRKLTANSGTR